MKASNHQNDAPNHVNDEMPQIIKAMKAVSILLVLAVLFLIWGV